jgi:hypothetical protein
MERFERYSTARTNIPEKQAQFDNLMKKFGEFEGGIFQFLSNAIKPQSGSPSIGQVSGPNTPSTNFPLPKPTIVPTNNTSSSNLFGSSSNVVHPPATPTHTSPAVSTPKMTEGLYDDDVIPSSQN